MTTRDALRERMLRRLPPEACLVVAILRQALQDAAHPRYAVEGLGDQGWHRKENQAFAEARAWFRAQEAEVREWLALLNLPEHTYARLLAEAGLEEEEEEDTA